MTRVGLWRCFSQHLPACIRQTKTKTIFFILLALSALSLSKAAEAQSYQFSGVTALGGHTATTTVNLTNIGTPTTSPDGSGGTNYFYTLPSGTANTVTFNGGTPTSVNYSSSNLSGSTIIIDVNPSVTKIEMTFFAPAQGSQLDFEVQDDFSGVAGLAPGGFLPLVFPPLSSWTNNASFGLTLSGSFDGGYGITSINTVANGKQLGYCAPCAAAAAAALSAEHPGQTATGDPITIGTGNLFEQATDYATAGQNKLSLSRYYNSQGASVSTLATTLGGIWRHSYDRYLRISPPTGTATSVIAERADGQQLSFSWNGSAWVSDTDVDFTLIQAGSTWTLTDHDDTVETYSASAGVGTLSSIALRNGYTQTLAYTSGLLHTVTDSYSRVLTFTYSSGLLSNVTTPDSTTGISYGFTGGVFTSVTYPTSPATTLTYLYENTGSPLQLTGITDENGHRYATWGYDTEGRAVSSKMGDTLGANLTSLVFNSDGTVTVTNALGVADTYTFTTLQGVPKMSGISRAATSTTAAASESFGYDTNGYTNSVTDWNGNQTTYVNNAHGQPTTINEAVGSAVARTTTIVYDTTFVHLPATITAPQLTTTFGYDSSGNVHTKTETDTGTQTVPYSTNGTARTWTNTYTATGQLQTVTGPRTDLTQETQFGYTGGTLTSITDAASHVTTINTFTNGGLPTKITDPNNVVTNLTYDGRQRLLTSVLVTGAGNLTTQYAYDNAGNLTKTTLPDNSFLQNTYDNAHRLTRITNALGEYINYTLDALGDRTVSNIYTSGATLKRKHTATFDALGRILTDVGGMSQTTKYAYDVDGNAITVTDPKNHVAHQTFDALNRLSTHKDPYTHVTTTTYDAHDRVLSVKDPNSNTTSYVRDGFGRVIQITSPDSGTAVSHFDLADDMTQKTDGAGAVTNRTFDALNRELTRTFPADTVENVALTYDQTGTAYGFGVGRLTSVTDNDGSATSQYDERGNILHANRINHYAANVDVYATFDNASRIMSYQPPSAWTVTYTRDLAGQVTGIGTEAPGITTPTPALSSIAHLPFGPVSSFSFANGINRTTTYDLDYRQTLLKDQGTAAVQNLTYSYDADDNVHIVTDAVRPTTTQTMTYDNLDRMLSATSGTGGYGAYSWQYDSNGNRTQETGPTGTYTTSYYPGTNRVDSVSDNPTIYHYNNAGSNVTEYFGTYLNLTLAYDQTQQIFTPTFTGYGSPSSWSYYSANGARTLKQGAHTFNYYYLGEGMQPASKGGMNLLQESITDIPQRTVFLYLEPEAPNPMLVGLINITSTASTVNYVHTDRIGTPQYVTDSAQVKQWNATYLPFGWPTFNSLNGIHLNFIFPGMYADDETDLVYNGNRYYDPSTGTYVQSDPIGLDAGTTNTYVYARNNPFRFTDPTGTNFYDWPLSQAFQQLTDYQVGTLGFNEYVAEGCTAGIFAVAASAFTPVDAAILIVTLTVFGSSPAK